MGSRRGTAGATAAGGVAAGFAGTVASSLPPPHAPSATSKPSHPDVRIAPRCRLEV
jgi:hypothetical protein